ncbi:MAG TPA: sigma 54-interacting transcriptional regulator, partial [Bryobacteraceae bacterium]|nr:sigma 54-interacting transcriptional regulator [Bryobacteraceae bacterium]
MSEPAAKTAQTVLVASRDEAKQSTSRQSDSRLPWIGASSASRELLELARKVADTSTTLLITGESGTGKDRLARWIHEESSRREAPFLKIDCASLTPELVESELFGHEKGAFTGAVAQKPGRLELADDGTIVLDEVAALP